MVLLLLYPKCPNLVIKVSVLLFSPACPIIKPCKLSAPQSRAFRQVLKKQRHLLRIGVSGTCSWRPTEVLRSSLALSPHAKTEQGIPWIKKHRSRNIYQSYSSGLQPEKVSKSYLWAPCSKFTRIYLVLGTTAHTYWEFPKIRVPYVLGVLIRRVLLFSVRY